MVCMGMDGTANCCTSRYDLTAGVKQIKTPPPNDITGGGEDKKTAGAHFLPLLFFIQSVKVLGVNQHMHRDTCRITQRDNWSEHQMAPEGVDPACATHKGNTRS